MMPEVVKDETRVDRIWERPISLRVLNMKFFFEVGRMFQMIRPGQKWLME